jgi:coenzyme F420-reducing hydrogenase delta subunit
MTPHARAEVIAYLCKNSLPQGGRLPAQWSEGDVHVRVKEIPCSGKIDTQYLFHALEGGVLGVCVITCPKGECTLTQGNYRAEVRVRTAQRLLGEIGIEPQRAVLLNCPPDATADVLKGLISEAARRMADAVSALT